MPRAHAGVCLGVQGGEPLLNAKYAPCDIRDMNHVLDLMGVCDDEQSICFGGLKNENLSGCSSPLPLSLSLLTLSGVFMTWNASGILLMFRK